MSSSTTPRQSGLGLNLSEEKRKKSTEENANANSRGRGVFQTPLHNPRISGDDTTNVLVFTYSEKGEKEDLDLDQSPRKEYLEKKVAELESLLKKKEVKIRSLENANNLLTSRANDIHRSYTVVQRRFDDFKREELAEKKKTEESISNLKIIVDQEKKIRNEETFRFMKEMDDKKMEVSQLKSVVMSLKAIGRVCGGKVEENVMEKRPRDVPENLGFDEDAEDEPKKRRKVEKKKNVIFSGFTEEKEKYNLKMQTRLTEMVEKLGGNVVNGKKSEVMESVTHVVLVPNVRTMKAIALAAQGVCIVRPDWIESSSRKGEWVETTDFGFQNRNVPILEDGAKTRYFKAMEALVKKCGGSVSSDPDLADIIFVETNRASKNVLDGGKTRIGKFDLFDQVLPLKWNPENESK